MPAMANNVLERPFRAIALASVLALLGGCCTTTPAGPSIWLVADGHTRIADPKLDGGGGEVAFHLEPAGTSTPAVAEVLQGGVLVTEIWSGTLSGGASPTVVSWDGTDPGGDFVDTGDYSIRIRGNAAAPAALEMPLSIVRLGITEIEARPGPGGDDEWQMVYFKKGASYAFFATPAIHEYLNVAEVGEVSDLDLDSGAPRPVPAVHAATDEPALEGGSYEDDAYNYPLGHLAGARLRLAATFGGAATSAAGLPMSVGYPLPGFDIRARMGLGGATLAASGPILPAGQVVLDGPSLPNQVSRVDLPIEWSWQYRAQGAIAWADIPGATVIPHRVYTTIGQPRFKAGASGTQYAGPWVEVAEYLASWKETLGLAADSEAACVEIHVQGFFGQNGGIPTAIEGMVYDAFPLGGDGGATHYLDFVTWNMDLSALLNGHDNGVYFNCSDNMGATTTMLSMMGVDNVRPIRLGNMTLRSIWGIGSPGYTTDLWGGSHGFSYHHIATRDDGFHVIDSCMQLDEDGDPSSAPGVPGWNHDRLWDGPGGYDDLSATNTVTKTLQALPGLN
jgi:hypothetical protein